MSLRTKRVFSRLNAAVFSVLLFGVLTVFAVSTRVFSSAEQSPENTSVAAVAAPTAAGKAPAPKSVKPPSAPETEISSAPLDLQTNGIAFTRAEYGDRNIFTVDGSGGAAARLTNSFANGDEPRFSLTGAKIAFTSTRDGSRREIYSMNPDGFNQTRLSKDGYDDYSPAFSPDGSKIAFAANIPIDLESGGNRDALEVMDADGGNRAGRAIRGDVECQKRRNTPDERGF